MGSDGVGQCFEALRIYGEAVGVFGVMVNELDGQVGNCGLCGVGERRA